MKLGTVFVILVLLLAGCSAREAPAVVPVVTTPSVPAVTTPASVAPAVSETPTPAAVPVRSVTTPPPGASTTSAETIGDTADCKVKADCVSYTEIDGTPAELCAEYDELGCYHHYACAPSGEVVQKETPAFCGR